MKITKIIIGLLFFVLMGSRPVWAADQVELFYGFYKDDQHLRVNSPSLKISKDILENTSVTIKYSYETFEKDAPANTMDAVTGATTVSGGTGSGFNEVRQEVIGGVTQRIGLTTLAASYFYSTESDYLSNAYTVAVSQELFNKNLTLTALFGQAFDQVYNLTDPNGFPKAKDTDTYSFAATQILTPQLLVSGGYSYSHVDGFLSSPQRKINAAIPGTVPPQSTIFDEKEPDLRIRQTFFLRLKQYFLSQTTADLNLTYYTDDWGVHAFSAEPRVEQYLTDNLVARLRFRYYTQTAADFYQPLYCTTPAPAYTPTPACPSPATPATVKTADVRLREFNAYTIGARLGILAFMDWSAYLSYDHYWETNQGLKADIVELTVQIPY